MNAAIRSIFVALLCAAIVTSETHGANFSLPDDDGWYTWQVEATDGSELHLYALVEDGEPVRFRARGNSICFSGTPVKGATDLGFVAADQSIIWLQSHIYPVSDLSSEVILMISLHAGELPVDILEQLLFATL